MYSDNSLEELDANKRKWTDAAEKLVQKILVRDYQNDSAFEYARHGLSRRLKSLAHLTLRVFEILPPNSIELPSNRIRRDAEAFIQSFLVNVYGALDNMARIWCIETDVKDKKGVPIADKKIGFGPKNIQVRESLPAEFLSYLCACDAWFGYLESYRHAVAHRIPVYIPPAILSDQEASEYQRIETQINEALGKKDFDLWGDLMARQRALGNFKPIMTHSLVEKARPVTLHAQMICDLATVVEIGECLLKHLPTR